MITLATLPTATKQEIFDQVAEHLLKQNKRSLQEDSTKCMYRGPNGLKCAAGCLIADNEYDEKWDSGSATSWAYLCRNGYVPMNANAFIGQLQELHDMHTPDEWPKQLLNCASLSGLDNSVVTAFLQRDRA